MEMKSVDNAPRFGGEIRPSVLAAL